MTAENTFDLLVIGAGPAGYVCAIRAAQLGLKTACVESSQTLGGTCLNVGCIPSKALLESSHHFHKVNHELEGHGIIVSKAKLDLKKMLERKNHVVSSMTQGVDFLLKKNKVTRLTGKASFISTTEVKITDGKKSTTVKAEKTVIATGSEPIELPFAPFDHEYIVDSSDALNFSKVPKDLVIIGGGVIGLELGSVWQRLGSNVTVIEFSSKLMGKTDKQMSSTMQRILEKQGLKIYLESKAQKIEIKGKKAQVSFDKKGTSQTFQADKILIAVGRKANTKDLNLAKIGLSLDKQGKIAVSKNWQTVKPNIFAIGDVTHGPMLAHKASDEGIAVAEHIAGKTSHVN